MGKIKQMTPEQILKKAIERAVKNGYATGFRGEEELQAWLSGFMPHFLKDFHRIIFSHDFAKAFWGEEKPRYDENRICLHCGVHIDIQPPFKSGCNHAHYPEDCKICSAKEWNWQYHLQQKVLEKEPLLYLERFLDEKR